MRDFLCTLIVALPHTHILKREECSTKYVKQFSRSKIDPMTMCAIFLRKQSALIHKHHIGIGLMCRLHSFGRFLRKSHAGMHHCYQEHSHSDRISITITSTWLARCTPYCARSIDGCCPPCSRTVSYRSSVRNSCSWRFLFQPGAGCWNETGSASVAKAEV